jgi:hypothetical protein
LKERLVTFALAIAALVLCYGLFLPKPQRDDEIPKRPLTTELGPTGYLAAWRWLKAEHIRVAVSHERYDSLRREDKLHGATGNILLTTLPHKLRVRTEEAAELDAWVESGNTLLVAAALDDTPPWALLDGAKLIVDAGRLTRLKFEVIDPGAAVPAAPKGRTLSALSTLMEPRTIVIEPRGAHPLMKGILSVQAFSDLPASRWRATPMDQSGVLQIGQVAGVDDAAIWVRRQGKGQVIVLAVAGLFTNRDIGTGDNARLLSNVIAWALKSGGAVIFDDAHQGAVSYYDAKAFFADPRLHRTLWWLVFLWFAFVLGTQRLKRHANDWHPADVTALLGVSGRFFASTLTPVAVSTRLLANFFNAIRRRLGLREDGVPSWEWLSRQGTVSSSELAELREYCGRVEAGKGVDLFQLQNLLSRLQGKII